MITSPTASPNQGCVRSGVNEVNATPDERLAMVSAAPVAQAANLRSLARSLRRTQTYFRLMAKIYPRKKHTYRELATPCGQAAAVLEMTFRKGPCPSEPGVLNGNPEATARALRARREDLRLGRPELARLSGVSRGTIRNLESGLCAPTTQTLERLFKVLYPQERSAEFAAQVDGVLDVTPLPRTEAE